ncbi:MAG: MFS transporter [Rubrimonas sp.]|uniref:MFS transporter n=1 Tax=Rubrimonas sp. TaxID=2036015 RepID=UPI002FDEC79B
MTADRLRLGALAAYALPAAPLAALYFPVYVYLAPFYAAERGVALSALGALLIGVRLLDAVTDPLMGWISDRTRSRLGRRRLWLAVSTPLVVASVWMLLVPPADAGFGHAAIWMVALTLSWTVALTPYFAWGAEITPDYAGRARVTAWREGAALVGTVAAVLLYTAQGDAAGGLRAVALFVALGLPLGVLVALRGAPEPALAERSAPGVAEALGALRDNAPFRRLLAAYFINGAANALPAGLFLFFIDDYLAAPDAGWVLLIYFLCAIGGMPLWSWAARRWSKHRAWGAAMLWACAIFALVPLLGPGDVFAFAAISALTGLALGADLSLPPAMQADVVDLDTARTGARRAGLFFALWSVATKAALAVSGGLALIALDVAGFQPGAENDAGALTALALLYAAAPVALKLVAVSMMWNFPLDRAAQEGLRDEIALADASATNVS